MIVIIAGSRTIDTYSIIETAVRESGFDITEVLSGGARGVDLLGEEYAREHGIKINRKVPDWSKGKGAGYARNAEMVRGADALIAVWDGVSRGTVHTINCAKEKGIPIYIVRCVKMNDWHHITARKHIPGLPPAVTEGV